MMDMFSAIILMLMAAEKAKATPEERETEERSHRAAMAHRAALAKAHDDEAAAPYREARRLRNLQRLKETT